MRKAAFMTPGTRDFVERRGGSLVISRQAIMVG